MYVPRRSAPKRMYISIYVIPYSTLPYSTLLYSTLLYSTLLYTSTRWRWRCCLGVRCVGVSVCRCVGVRRLCLCLCLASVSGCRGVGVSGCRGRDTHTPPQGLCLGGRVAPKALWKTFCGGRAVCVADRNTRYVIVVVWLWMYNNCNCNVLFVYLFICLVLFLLSWATTYCTGNGPPRH